jgi:septal ring factor EnvC (AmiA/AmiB activator)
MIATMTRQDLMSVTADSRNKIIERLVTKYDVQAAADSARDRILGDLNAMHLENQANIRQANAQRDQLWRKTAALETQILTLQQEVKRLTEAINQHAGSQITNP